MSKERKFGALPPADKAWEVGKTAATIRFVREAEEYIQSGQAEADGIQPNQALELGRAVRDLKSGERTLTRLITVKDFLLGDCLDD